MSATLGVPTLTCFPYAVFTFASPLVVIALAFPLLRDRAGSAARTTLNTIKA